jgi:hypothetical protein
MFLAKIKNLLKPPEKLEADLILNQQIRTSFQATLAPLKVSVAPLVMEKIKAKATKKNALSYRLNHGLVPVALTICLVFALTGIGFFPDTSNSRAPTFSVSPAPSLPSGSENNSFVGAPSKAASPPTNPIDNTAATKLKEKSKTRVFFEKIWKFILTLWQ